jgi:mono/diheme cytochrome c family protein
MKLNPFPTTASMLLVSVVALNFSMPPVAYGQPTQAPASDPTSAGKAVFSKANCVGCHKWHGHGGGGYGGDALSLRKTELTRDQIIETVGCGRPATGMPFFVRGAYDEVKCYGMNRQEAGAQIPPEGGTFLRPKDIEAVADYVIAHIKGAGEPTYAECVAFFASASRVCDVYKTQGQKPEDAAASTGKSQ